jgi:hypothetical protein
VYTTRHEERKVKSIAQQTAAQVQQNYEAFNEKLSGLLPKHRGEYALMKDGQIVGFFNTAMDAYVAGEAQLGLGNFSMQKVVDEPIDLGYFSHGVH